MGNFLMKLVFIVAAIAGVVLVFFVSWFWRLLLVPMILIVIWDVGRGFFKKPRRK